MRLIDADAFKEKVIDLLEIEWGYEEIREDVSRIIDNVPTVERPHGTWRIDGTDYEDGKVTALYVSHEFHGLDYARFVPDRPHGEWIDKGEYAECSICGSCSGTQFDGVEPIPLKTNFCPNCGASMRVKDELNRVSKELNSEIEKSKSEIVPDYRDGWRLREGEEK